MENQTDNLNDLLIKYSEGTMSSDDYEHLLDALNHSSDEDVFNVLGMHWDSFSCDENKDFYHEKRVQLYESLSRKIHRHKRPEENKSTVETFVIWKWFWIAASFVLLAIGSWFVSNYMDNVRASDWDGQNVVVQSGTIGNSSVLLPDGSKVTLNAKSRLSYGADFGKNGRRVLLDGQGFFEVLHHDDNKFVVETKFMDITVYGTVFNVYAYEDNGIVEMSLLDGNVRVETKGASSQCFNVQPNEKVTYNKATGEAFLEPTDNVLETAWMKDYLVFREEKLGTVFSKLERRFGIMIKVDDNAMLSDVYTGTFDDERLGGIMKVLQMHYKFRYEIEDDTVYVYFDKK